MFVVEPNFVVDPQILFSVLINPWGLIYAHMCIRNNEQGEKKEKAQNLWDMNLLPRANESSTNR